MTKKLREKKELIHTISDIIEEQSKLIDDWFDNPYMTAYVCINAIDSLCTPKYKKTCAGFIRKGAPLPEKSKLELAKYFDLLY